MKLSFSRSHPLFSYNSPPCRARESLIPTSAKRSVKERGANVLTVCVRSSLLAGTTRARALAQGAESERDFRISRAKRALLSLSLSLSLYL